MVSRDNEFKHFEKLRRIIKNFLKENFNCNFTPELWRMINSNTVGEGTASFEMISGDRAWVDWNKVVELNKQPFMVFFHNFVVIADNKKDINTLIEQYTDGSNKNFYKIFQYKHKFIGINCCRDKLKK